MHNFNENVITEMTNMGLTQLMAVDICHALKSTYSARLDIGTPARTVAAELVYVWATGLAASAEAVYNSAKRN